MQKVSLLFLLALLAFAAIFALLPTPDRVAANTGAHLQDVQLALYPMRDPDAVWQFSAAQVSNDPTTGTTELRQLSQGERLLRQKNAQGAYTGKETLDATLRAQNITIDNQDNLLTDQAQITLVKHCADIDLKGRPGEPVRIDQGFGFIVPVAEMTSPSINGHIEKLQMTFDFKFQDADPDHSNFTYDLDATTQCVNGRRVTQGS